MQPKRSSNLELGGTKTLCISSAANRFQLLQFCVHDTALDTGQTPRNRHVSLEAYHARIFNLRDSVSRLKPRKAASCHGTKAIRASPEHRLAFSRVSILLRKAPVLYNGSNIHTTFCFSRNCSDSRSAPPPREVSGTPGPLPPGDFPRLCRTLSSGAFASTQNLLGVA
jgi:hypothetical protein